MSDNYCKKKIETVGIFTFIASNQKPGNFFDKKFDIFADNNTFSEIKMNVNFLSIQNDCAFSSYYAEVIKHHHYAIRTIMFSQHDNNSILINHQNNLLAFLNIICVQSTQHS